MYFLHFALKYQLNSLVFCVSSIKNGSCKIFCKSIFLKPIFLASDNKVHLGLLFDEYGGVSGLVTMEDLIEEIMGDIEDEYDKEESIISQIDENNFYIKGNLAVSDFNSTFDINVEEGEYDTMNGYLLTMLGKLPKEGTLVELDEVDLLVNKVDNRRIEQIKVTLKRSIESI